MPNDEIIDAEVIEDFPIFDDDPGRKVVDRRLVSEIPAEHCTNGDTRMIWLWNQRLIIAQNIKLKSKDPKSVLAATVILAAAMAEYLPSIELLLTRLEGGAVPDQTIVEQDSMPV